NIDRAVQEHGAAGGDIVRHQDDVDAAAGDMERVERVAAADAAAGHGDHAVVVGDGVALYAQNLGEIGAGAGQAVVHRVADENAGQPVAGDQVVGDGDVLGEVAVVEIAGDDDAAGRVRADNARVDDDGLVEDGAAED